MDVDDTKTKDDEEMTKAEIPGHWKQFVFDDELIVKMKSDGACGF